jgi:hypothetical protein
MKKRPRIEINWSREIYGQITTQEKSMTFHLTLNRYVILWVVPWGVYVAMVREGVFPDKTNKTMLTKGKKTQSKLQERRWNV